MDQPLKIAICDDDPIDAEQLKAYIEAAGPEVEIDSFSSGEALLEKFAYGMFHIIFLDIQLTGITGVETARIICKRDSGCIIIFTTISRDYAVEAYALNALHYIVKPLSEQKVRTALTRALDRLEEGAKRVCTVTVDRKSHTIPHRDIIYAEVYDMDCLIHTPKGVIQSHTPIDKLVSLLPTPPFLRCHRSYIVNMDYIESINTDFTMSTGDVVYIRQTELKRIKEQYMRYLMQISAEGGALCIAEK